MPHRRVHGGLGKGQRRVDAAAHLGRGAGEVGDHPVAVDGEGDFQRDRVRVDAVVVDPVGEFVTAVRHLGDGRAREPLGLSQEHGGAGLEALGAMLGDELEIGALARETGGDLGAHIAEHLTRHPNVPVDQLEHRLDRSLRRVELDGGDPQPFLKDLGGVAAIAAGRLAAHVELMSDAGGPADKGPLQEDRLEDVEVRQMRATLVGVVQDEDVARMRPPRELLAHAGHGVGDGAEVKRQRQPLGDEPPLRVAERAGHVHGVLEVVRVRGAHERDGHLVHDRVERVLDQLVQDGVAQLASGQSILPCRSRCCRGCRGG